MFKNSRIMPSRIRSLFENKSRIAKTINSWIAFYTFITQNSVDSKRDLTVMLTPLILLLLKHLRINLNSKAINSEDPKWQSVEKLRAKKTYTLKTSIYF